MASSFALQLHNPSADPSRRLAILQQPGARKADPVALIFASKLIVCLPGPRSTSIDEISVVDALGAGSTLRQWMTLDHLTAATEDQSSQAYTLVVLPLEDISGLDLRTRLKFTLRADGSPAADVFARPHVLQLDGEADQLSLGFVATVAESGGLDARALALFGPLVRRMSGEEMGRVSLLRAHRTADAVIVEGIIENLAFRDLALATRDLSVVVSLERMILRATDAQPVRDTETHETSGTQEGGGEAEEERLSLGGTLVQHFTAVFQHALSPIDEIVVLELRNEELLVSDPIALPPGRMSQGALSDFIEELGQEAGISPEQATAVLAPLLPVLIPVPSPTHYRFGPELARPKISIIIALSGEELFLRCILAQQAVLPRSVEWILCAEHTAASAKLLQLLSSLSGRLSRSLTLILVDSLCGPVRLKNLGVKAAAADTLAFLDEGAWIEDMKAWLIAYREVRERRFDIVGVGCHFSDGTLDNEGLLRSRARGNPLLQRVDFRRRGFPSPDGGGRTSVEPVEAVSSVAMLTSRARFETVGGYQDSYTLGDFADLDLSLRAAQAGARIGFVRGKGIMRGRSGAELGLAPVRAKAYALLEGARLALAYPLDADRKEITR